MKPSSSSECPGSGVLRTPLHAQPTSGTLRLWRLPAQSTGESREEVGERVGWLLRIWPQEWSRVWVPGGVQFSANVSRCRKGVDIPLLNVRATPVGEFQQLQCEKRTVGGQVKSGVEIAQKVSVLAPVGPLQTSLVLEALCVGEPSSANNARRQTGQLEAHLLAIQIHTCSSLERQCRRLVLLCQSQSRRRRGHRARRRERGHVASGAKLRR